MSAGNKREEAKTVAQVYGALGSGDTAELYGQPYKVVTNRDIAYAGGTSVDRQRVYIDEQLYKDVMSGTVAVKGLTPNDIIRAWLEHEHTEKATDDGDNPYDDYSGAHAIALGKENWFIEQRIGKDGVERYESTIKPALDACARRFIAAGNKANPPTDLWCGPYIDDQTAQDKKIIAILKAKGVTDAFKWAKSDAHYGMGATQCRDCKHFAPTISQENGRIGDCEQICGLVRWDRTCDEWTPKKD